MGENTLRIDIDCDLGAVFISKSPGQAARPARQRGNREQEVVELNSKVPCGLNETKAGKSRSKSLRFALPSVRLSVFRFLVSGGGGHEAGYVTCGYSKNAPY